MTDQGHIHDAPTLMHDEIEEIPDVVRHLVADQADQFSRVVAGIRAARPRLAIIAARGTSDHAAIYAKYLLEAELGLPAALAASSLTTIYGRSPRWAGALVVSLSQSGASPDILAVTEAARAGGATTVAITNDPESPLARAAEFSVACGAGLERAVAATKTYVAELAAIAALVARLSDDADLLRGLDRLPAHLSDVLVITGGWIARSETLVEMLASADRMLVVSRGFNLPTALEIALKFKETAGIFAEGYSSADLMHGPVALARPAVPVLVFRPNGPMGRAMDAVVERLVDAGSQTWLVGGGEIEEANAPVRGRLALPNGVPEMLTPLAFVIPGYLLAATVALRRGMNPDAPDGLSKITRTT